jgi:hypothetical protein
LPDYDRFARDCRDLAKLAEKLRNIATRTPDPHLLFDAPGFQSLVSEIGEKARKIGDQTNGGLQPRPSGTI